MSDPPHADRGNIITYLDDTDPESSEFRRAVVTGSGIADPETGIVWVSIVRPDCELTMIDPGMIVTEPNEDAIDILAVALNALATGMIEVDERAPVALRDTRELLTCFAHAIDPIGYSLSKLVETDPFGGLARVLGWIGSAMAEFERGHVAVGRSGILMANSAMTELAPPPEGEP